MRLILSLLRPTNTPFAAQERINVKKGYEEAVRIIRYARQLVRDTLHYLRTNDQYVLEKGNFNICIVMIMV